MRRALWKKPGAEPQPRKFKPRKSRKRQKQLPPTLVEFKPAQTGDAHIMASFLQQHLGATLDIVDIDGKRFVSVLDRSEYRLTKDTARLLDQALRLCVEGFRPHELSLFVIRQAQSGQRDNGVNVVDRRDWARLKEVRDFCGSRGIAMIFSPDARFFGNGRLGGHDTSFYSATSEHPTYKCAPETYEDLGRVAAYGFLAPSHSNEGLLPVFRKHEKETVDLRVGLSERDLASFKIPEEPYLKVVLDPVSGVVRLSAHRLRMDPVLDDVMISLAESHPALHNLVDVKSPAALRLITRPCELQAILLENDLDSSAVKMVPLRRKRGLSVQLRMAHPTQEQIEAYQRVFESLRAQSMEYEELHVGVHLGYQFMDTAGAIINKAKSSDRRLDATTGVEAELSEAGGIEMRVDGPFVTGQVDDKILREAVQAKVEARVKIIEGLVGISVERDSAALAVPAAPRTAPTSGSASVSAPMSASASASASVSAATATTTPPSAPASASAPAPVSASAPAPARVPSSASAPASSWASATGGNGCTGTATEQRCPAESTTSVPSVGEIRAPTALVASNLADPRVAAGTGYSEGSSSVPGRSRGGSHGGCDGSNDDDCGHGAVANCGGYLGGQGGVGTQPGSAFAQQEEASAGVLGLPVPVVPALPAASFNVSSRPGPVQEAVGTSGAQEAVGTSGACARPTPVNGAGAGVFGSSPPSVAATKGGMADVRSCAPGVSAPSPGETSVVPSVAATAASATSPFLAVPAPTMELLANANEDGSGYQGRWVMPEPAQTCSRREEQGEEEGGGGSAGSLNLPEAHAWSPPALAAAKERDMAPVLLAASGRTPVAASATAAAAAAAGAGSASTMERLVNAMQKRSGEEVMVREQHVLERAQAAGKERGDEVGGDEEEKDEDSSDSLNQSETHASPSPVKAEATEGGMAHVRLDVPGAFADASGKAAASVSAAAGGAAGAAASPYPDVLASTKERLVDAMDEESDEEGSGEKQGRPVMPELGQAGVKQGGVKTGYSSDPLKQTGASSPPASAAATAGGMANSSPDAPGTHPAAPGGTSAAAAAAAAAFPSPGQMKVREAWAEFVREMERLSEWVHGAQERFDEKHKRRLAAREAREEKRKQRRQQKRLLWIEKQRRSWERFVEGIAPTGKK